MSRSVLLTSAQKHWRLTAALTIWTCEFVFALTLFYRWMAGAFTAEPLFWFGAFVSIVLCAAACLARAFAHQNKFACGCCCSKEVFTIGADSLTIFPPFLCGIALLPFNSAMSISFLIVLTLLLCVAAFFVAESSHLKVLHYLNVIMWGESAMVPQNNTHEINLSLEERLLQQADFSVEANGSVVTQSKQISQSMTRQVNEEGCEIISGTALVTVVAGARQANVHIPFSPPLRTKPEVICEIEADHSARVIPTATYSYGTRLEVRLAEPAEEEVAMEITFSATTTAE